MAGRLDLQIKQGDTFSVDYTYKNSAGTAYNLTGYTATLNIKTTLDATTYIDVITTATGEIVITPTTGKIAITVPATTTASYTFEEAIYDLTLTAPSGIVKTILEGNVYLIPSV